MNRKTSMSDSIGTTAYTYDALGNLIVEDGPFADDTLYYDYTPDRQLAAITSSFYKVEYAYDALGRLSTVIGAEGTNTYAYTAAGTLWTNLTLANGTTAERQFDALLRLTNLVNRADAGILSSFALTLDDADQRTQVIREDGKVFAYGYDAIGQLTNASASLPDGTPWPGYQFSYTYDATGNPVEQHKNGLVYSNTFNNLNQNVDTIPSGTLTVLGEVNYPSGTATVNNVQAQIAPDGTFAAPDIPIAIGTNTLASVFTDPFGRTTNTETSVTLSSKTYGYDLNGNLTNDSRFVYTWDYENRLTAVHDAKTGALVQENRYDALWRRREKVEYAPDGTATTNRYIYKDWLVLAITDDYGTILEKFTYGTDLSGEVGGSAGGILSSSKTGIEAYCVYDYAGNIIYINEKNGARIAQYMYSPFGQVLFKTGFFESRYQFSAKEYDIVTEFTYYGYRFYSAREAKWINTDPIGENDSINLYSFVHNDSIDLFDYLGAETRTNSKVIAYTEWIYISSGKPKLTCLSATKVTDECGKCTHSEVVWLVTTPGMRSRQEILSQWKEERLWCYSLHNAGGAIIGSLCGMINQNVAGKLASIAMGALAEKAVSMSLHDSGWKKVAGSEKTGVLGENIWDRYYDSSTKVTKESCDFICK